MWGSLRNACQHRRSVKDARGRCVALLDPYELNLLRRYDVIPAHALTPIAEHVGFGLPKWHRRGYLACIVIFVTSVAFLILWKVKRGTGIDPVERILWPTNLAVLALGAVQFWRRGRQARLTRMASVMLRHLRCPHCGYDLRLLPRDTTDRCTICPECGCAWSLNRGNTLVHEAPPTESS